MMKENNILLVSEDEEYCHFVKKRISLLRESDNIDFCTQTSDIKKIITKHNYSIVLLQECESQHSTLKTIQIIHSICSDLKIILITDSQDPEFIFQAYDEGITDYICKNFKEHEMLIKIINANKYFQLKLKADRDEKLLKTYGIINHKTDMYESRYLPQIYSEINQESRIINGVFIMLTIDPKTKTKISINRLAGILKNSTRNMDILASSRNGKFFIILSDIDIESAKSFVTNVQDQMGEDVHIRSGLSRIGIQTYETLEKNTKDSLQSAIQNDELSVSLTDNNNSGNIWLNNTNNNVKPFKLFYKIYIEKLNEVIAPTFYRMQKNFEEKLPDTQIGQYSNDIESVFSLKNDNAHSELILRPIGAAKLSAKINHKGLNSEENTSLEIPFNKLSDKEIIKLLNKLKDEYIKTAYIKE